MAEVASGERRGRGEERACVSHKGSLHEQDVKFRVCTYPFGCPVNLSQRMVTLLICPHAAKWPWISSGVDA